MRGLAVPQQKGAVDWPFAQENLRESIGHLFLEALIMGRKRQVFAHVIVPTCLGILLDEARHMSMAKAILKQSHHKILLKQDSIMTSCARCLGQVPSAERKPYQMVVRLIGALEKEKGPTWSYDAVLGILCRQCETLTWRSLMLVKETDYVAIAEVIEEHGFRSPLSVEQFMDVKRHGPDVFTISSMALVESYVYRLDQANEKTREAIQAIRTDMDDAPVCYHCNRASHVDLKYCRTCKAVAFCSDASPDVRLGQTDMSCYELAQIYHGPLCNEIRKNKLFHTEQSMYVERDGDFECVPCFLSPEEEEV